ncbi:MAG: alanine--tRNA ligase-related protein, partial [Gammaproteobacteria bacterium]|nr:alanine--tRNA ligase-related protein [Gammaproteobacteria bacterium]
YGFPVDLTADIARGRGLAVDMPGYDAAMARQRERSRRSSGMSAEQDESPESEGIPPSAKARRLRLQESVPPSEFTGYERLENPAHVIGIRIGGEAAEQVKKGKTAEVVLDRTPFYAESGGQVGDTGVLAGKGLRFKVRDTQQTSAGRAHIGVVADGTLSVGDDVTATVDAGRRRDIVLNHSATHLMNAALRKVLGKHVAQKGSLVAPDRLRL